MCVLSSSRVLLVINWAVNKYSVSTMIINYCVEHLSPRLSWLQRRVKAGWQSWAIVTQNLSRVHYFIQKVCIVMIWRSWVFIVDCSKSVASATLETLFIRGLIMIRLIKKAMNLFVNTFKGFLSCNLKKVIPNSKSNITKSINFAFITFSWYRHSGILFIYK